MVYPCDRWGVVAQRGRVAVLGLDQGFQDYTRWWSRTPAISKSELVRLPVGLKSDTTEAVISGGLCTRHTVGTMLWVPLNHTPPAPLPLASQCLM